LVVLGKKLLDLILIFNFYFFPKNEHKQILMIRILIPKLNIKNKFEKNIRYLSMINLYYFVFD
jgi:hypothetical protein